MKTTIPLSHEIDLTQPSVTMSEANNSLMMAPQSTLNQQRPRASKKDSRPFDIPTKIIDKLETDDLDSYVHYKDLVEKHQCRLSEIAVPEETTEDSNGQLKIAVRCQVCQKVCSCWNKLQYHLQTHVNLRPYKCTVCDKKFYAASKLHRHKQTHSGNKPHKCPLCDVRVSRQEHLKRHMLVHFEEKPYKCSSCNHGARRLDSIRQHIKSKHPGEDVDWVFIGGDSETRKEFVAKFLEENLKKCAAGSKDKVPKAANYGTGESRAQYHNLQPNSTFDQESQSTKPVVVLSKKKNKRKRKGSNPQHIKETLSLSKSPDQISNKPSVKREDLNEPACCQSKDEQMSVTTAKCERPSSGEAPCSPNGSGMGKDYQNLYMSGFPNTWTQQPVAQTSNFSPQHNVSQPSSQQQGTMPFRSQQTMHYSAAGLRYPNLHVSGQASLPSNFFPQNPNWNGHYHSLPQMAAQNIYGHGLGPMMMPNNIGQIQPIAIQAINSVQDEHIGNEPDYYRKRMSKHSEELNKTTSRQQNDA